ncbi:hypothetical protein KCU87_g214, partial [Aureobasidium melanogenum]
MGEDKGQDFKLEAPCLFPLARPEQKMAEVPIWLMSGGPRRSAHRRHRRSLSVCRFEWLLCAHVEFSWGSIFAHRLSSAAGSRPVPILWVNQVQSLRTNLAESGNRSTDDKVLLVSEQGGEVFGDLRKTALRTMGLMSAVPFLIASETIWLMSGIRTPAIVFSAMARTRGLESGIRICLGMM